MGREQVMEMLWPGLDIDLAANRLNGAVHELRQILEPDISRPSSSRLLRLERDIFELADNTLIWVDAESFEQLLKDAEMCIDTRQAERLLEEAAALYQGSYLPEELYSEWAVPRRDALQRAWVGLQLRLTQTKVARGAYISAIECLDRLLTADPTNETALQHFMTLLTHLDRRAEALQLYKQYRAMLKRDYESLPLPETAELYEKLRKGHVPSLSSIVGIGQAQTGRDLRTTDPSGGDKPTPLRGPQEDEDDTLSYTRPLFQLGHQHQSPLIGRERESQRMRQLLLTIEQQAGQQTSSKTEMSHSPPTHFLLLIGEPGIGKTRLAEELGLEAYNRGWTVAWSRSYEQEGAIPYHPWTEILRTLLGQEPALPLQTFSELATAPASVEESKNQSGHPLKLDQLSALLPELADHVHPTQPPPGISHEHKRFYLWEAILDLLAKLSKLQPLLLVFDDLHWADDSSIELLTYLTHRLQGQRVLLIGTCRNGELPPQHKLRLLTADLQRKHAITMIATHPLTPSQIGILVSYLPEKFIPIIQMQSSGNPLFAEELARFLYGRKADPHPGEQEQLDSFLLTEMTERENISSSVLPDAIAAVLERRLHRLSKECHTLLSQAAILGDSFELEQLRPMAPEEHNEDAILDLLEEALHAELLTEEERGTHIIYHFWHPLITNYLYNHLSATRRAQLQRRAAARSAISKSDPPESNRSGRHES
jgi:DNA-binding SARP family transcriptional activator